MALTMVEADDATAELDANHPLAGVDISFEVELVEVLRAGGDSGLTGC